MSANPQDGPRPSIVLVHGGFADGSGWQGVYNLLKDDYSVRIVQEPNPSSAAASPTRSIGAPAPRAT
jgi:pimeloyl-ACP methyl ester carboxylesterase